MENVNSTPKNAFQSGLIIGLISVVLTFVYYFIDSEILMSWKSSIPSLIISFGLLVYFGIQHRKSLGGFMSFGKAFNFSFITLLVYGLISSLGLLLLLTVVDPSLPAVLANAGTEMMVTNMEKITGSSLSVDQVDEMRKGMIDAYTPAGILKSFGGMTIGYAVLALIFGAILKRNDPSLDF
jgi:hypothetical protein